MDCNDFSPIYLRQNNKSISSFNLPIVGPIKISSKNVIEGRGLVATRDIQPGECLFAIQPIVSAPVEEVKRVWLSKCKGILNNGGLMDLSDEAMIDLTHKLEQISEIILVKRIKRILKSTNDKQAALSILSQVGDHFGTNEASKTYQTDDIETVAGVKSTNKEDDIGPTTISNDEILSIIHRNAFGPDYRQYQSIAQNWMNNPQKNPYGRTLGLFPLAAMINHSCTPNAIRVYSCELSTTTPADATGVDDTEVMIVHATQPIKAGEEILWSYVPTTKPYHDRQRRLKDSFGFESKCHRSQVESMLFENNSRLQANFESYLKWNERAIGIDENPPIKDYQELMSNFEDLISDKTIPSETSRYLRAGMVTFYTNYFNAVLSQSPDDESKAEVLNLASKMHLSLVSVDHGTTEHLSILHLCYELAAQQSQLEGGNKNLPKFWAGQLQKAHNCRYGRLGDKVDKLRDIMVHSRGVLRNRNGFESAKYCFI